MTTPDDTYIGLMYSDLINAIKQRNESVHNIHILKAKMNVLSSEIHSLTEASNTEYNLIAQLEDRIQELMSKIK